MAVLKQELEKESVAIERVSGDYFILFFKLIDLLNWFKLIELLDLIPSRVYCRGYLLKFELARPTKSADKLGLS